MLTLGGDNALKPFSNRMMIAQFWGWSSNGWKTFQEGFCKSL